MASEHGKLMIVSGPLAGSEFILAQPEGTVGRVDANDFVIRHKSVSRKHARLEAANGMVIVTDLDSQNGTYIEGQRITQAALQPGQTVRFGDVEAEFVAAQQAAAPAGQDFFAAFGTPAAPHEGPPAAELPPPSMMPAVQENPAAPVNLPAVNEQPLALEDVFGPSPEPTQESVSRPDGTVTEAEKRRGAALYTLTVVLLIAFGAAAYFYIEARPSGPPTTLVKLKRGQTRKIKVGYHSRIATQPDDPTKDMCKLSAVSMKLFKKDSQPRLVEIKALGEAPDGRDIYVYRGNRVAHVIRVLIKGSVKKQRPEWRQLTFTQRRDLARDWIKIGDSVRDDRPYTALRQYQLAAEILRPIITERVLYNEARAKERATNEFLDRRTTELIDQARIARNQDQPDKAQKYLADILALIPDEEDGRHQTAQIILSLFKVKGGRRR